MILIAWAVLGVVAGMVGSEILRAKKPKLVGKVEEAAKKFVDSFYPAGPSDEETGKKESDKNKSD